MPNLQATLSTILADAQSITLQGAIQSDSGSPVQLTVFESEPLDLSPRQTVTTVAALPGAFTISIPRWDGSKDRLYRRFYLTLSQDGAQPVACSGVCHVTELTGSPTDYSYPASPTIKGLQVHMIEDALRLGVGHAALNLNLGISPLRWMEKRITSTGCTWRSSTSG